MLIEALAPLRVKAEGKWFALAPGQVVDLSPDRAARLLERAHGKVRRVHAEHVTIEPAAEHARVVYWEQADGSIVGGCPPEFVAKEGHGAQASYWIVTTFRGELWWVNSNQLRSKQQFETQHPIRPVDAIKETHRRTP